MPAPSQRCAPLTETPSPGTLTASSRTKETASSGPVSSMIRCSDIRETTSRAAKPSEPKTTYRTSSEVPAPPVSTTDDADEAL